MLQAAILSNASSVVLVHNHPSGKLLPSTADRNLTGNLAQALQLVQIRVLDHLILSRESYYSFADNGEPSLL
ncbi:RadC [Microcystis phage Mae-Yong924-2]|nr:RadC [Microcystis phage Mae-Yong924-2]